SESTPVLMEVLEARSSAPHGYSNAYADMAVWLQSTNLDYGFPIRTNWTSSSPLVSPETILRVDPRTARTFKMFNAMAGSTYYLELVGADLSYVQFRLVASNVPVITEQPMTQAVDLNEPALFKVAAVGSPPLRYQRLFNGSALPDETNVSLALPQVR